jgi:hypothetical protein
VRHASPRDPRWMAIDGLFHSTKGMPWNVDEGSTGPINCRRLGHADGHLSSSDLRRGRRECVRRSERGVQSIPRPLLRRIWPRNPQRADGYLGLDAGLGKLFHSMERIGARFRWDVFNVTNSLSSTGTRSAPTRSEGHIRPQYADTRSIRASYNSP